MNYPPNIVSDVDRYRYLYAAMEAMRLKHNTRAGDSSAKANRFRAECKKVRFRLFEDILTLRHRVGTPGYKRPKDGAPDDPRLRLHKVQGKAAHKDVDLKALTGVDLDKLDGALPLGPDPTEDLSTFTNHDENGDLTLTAPKADVDTLRNDASCYVYDDKGAAHFGDGIDHDFEIYWDSAVTTGRAVAWALSNSTTSYYLWGTQHAEAIALLLYGGTDKWYVWDFEDGGGDYATAANVPQSTLHYCTASRSGTAVTLDFYSDSGRETLEDSIVTGVIADRTYQYVFVVNSYDKTTASALNLTFYVQNLDLNEGGGPPAAKAAEQQAWKFAFPWGAR